MSRNLNDEDQNARENQWQFRQGIDKLVAPPKFGAVCKVLWPQKTAENIAAISGRDVRTAGRWLAGEYEPPVIVLVAVMQEMFKRD